MSAVIKSPERARCANALLQEALNALPTQYFCSKDNYGTNGETLVPSCHRDALKQSRIGRDLSPN
jgi:hypothetical protein